MTSKPTIAIIRYKKDLRVADHRALCDAVKSGLPVIALYAREPSIMTHPDYSHFHQYWIQKSLKDLRLQLKRLNIPLLMIHEEILTALELISEHYDIIQMFAHEETGNMLTYKRDTKVIAYCKTHTIDFIETPTNGVVRRLASRDLRDAEWKRRMQQQIIPIPQPIPQWEIDYNLRSRSHDTMINFVPSVKPVGWKYDREIPGEQAGIVRLKLFIKSLSRSYLFVVSKPQQALSESSRLSAYITYGNLSIKQVYQTYQLKSASIQEEITQSADQKQIKYLRSHLRSLKAFSSRLHRHSHFIQKIESRPEIEHDNQNTEFDQVRQTINHNYITKRQNGMTGVPLVDAGMRCLAKIGRINFRMRAMLTSFICNTCIQPWQAIAHHLASVFVDYEPGIHYSQLQMQSGTTGINTIRIYNPLKQMKDKDEDLEFIRNWLPELGDMSNDEIGLLGTSAGNQLLIFKAHVYPPAMIDIVVGNRIARDMLREVMKDKRTKSQSRKVYQKIGSRSFDRHRWKKQISSSKSYRRNNNNLQESLFE